MSAGEVLPNTVFGESNVERKKYEPVYKIEVRLKNKHVLYVGKIIPSNLHNDLLVIKGVELGSKDDMSKLKGKTAEEFIYPIQSFVKIQKL